jgi:hypothetical protein
VSVVPPPRDLDPGILVWKGASVHARLKSSEREAFMTRRNGIFMASGEFPCVVCSYFSHGT